MKCNVTLFGKKIAIKGKNRVLVEVGRDVLITSQEECGGQRMCLTDFQAQGCDCTLTFFTMLAEATFPMDGTQKGRSTAGC